MKFESYSFVKLSHISHLVVINEVGNLNIHKLTSKSRGNLKIPQKKVQKCFLSQLTQRDFVLSIYITLRNYRNWKIHTSPWNNTEEKKCERKVNESKKRRKWRRVGTQIKSTEIQSIQYPNFNSYINNSKQKNETQHHNKLKDLIIFLLLFIK